MRNFSALIPFRWTSWTRRVTCSSRPCGACPSQRPTPSCSSTRPHPRPASSVWSSASRRSASSVATFRWVIGAAAVRTSHSALLHFACNQRRLKCGSLKGPSSCATIRKAIINVPLCGGGVKPSGRGLGFLLGLGSKVAQWVRITVSTAWYRYQPKAWAKCGQQDKWFKKLPISNKTSVKTIKEWSVNIRYDRGNVIISSLMSDTSSGFAFQVGITVQHRVTNFVPMCDS